MSALCLGDRGRSAVKRSGAVASALGLALWLVGPAGAQTVVTVNTDTLRSIGGVSQLDREKYFAHSGTLLPPSNTNLGDLNALTGSENGLNALTGRIATEFDQFIAQNLPEDSSRPGYIDPTALRNRLGGAYRNFVLNDSRYRQLRESGQGLIVNGGRYGTFFPSYFFEPGTGVPRTDPYVEFINIYLEEVVYGPNAFYPTSPDRFHVEILNEPDLHFSSSFTRDDYVDFHHDVAAGVNAAFPQASVGGPSLAVTNFEANEFGGSNNFSRFEERVGDLIAGAGDELAFYSIHPYERYDVQNDGSFLRQVDQSPGRINGQLDLIAARDLAVHGATRNGVPLPIALTEYGSFNRANSSGSYGNYTRDQQQWDLARDIREQMLIYLNRPDLILNATPFVAPRHFVQGSPTPEEGDNVFYEQDASGQWVETIVAKTFRAYANVSGSYIDLDINNPGNLQAAAFRDGDEVYVLLNNLQANSLSVDLSVLSELGTVTSATMDRVAFLGSAGVFLDDADVTGSFQNLSLLPDEGVVLTLTLSQDNEFSSETLEKTFYSTDTVSALTVPTGKSPVVTVDAEVGADALSAMLRVTYSRPPGFPDGEGFDVLVNGTPIDVQAEVFGIDDGDFGLQSREIDVPLNLLIDGVNDIQVDFEGNGGFLASTALVVTSLINGVLVGDYNGDGFVSQGDLDLVLLNWGDAVVPAGFDEAALPGGGPFDGLLGQNELDGVLLNWGDGTPPASNAIPEPATGVWLVLAGSACLRRRPC